MGGITESLVINGRIMDELNSPAMRMPPRCSPRRAQTIATAPPPAHAPRERLSEAFTDDAAYGRHRLLVRRYGERHAWDGFAVGIRQPPRPHQTGAVRQRAAPVALNPRLLFAGYLKRALPGTPQAVVSAPVIANPSAYLADAVAGWQRACEMLGLER